MTGKPLVTDEDRQRGFSEIEVELTDGTRQILRAHAVDASTLLNLRGLSAGDALVEALSKVLRVEKDLVSRIHPKDHVYIGETLSSLLMGEAGAQKTVETAATAAGVMTFRAAAQGVVDAGLVSAEDLARGWKKLQVTKQNGETLEVTVHRLSWAATVRATFTGDPGEAMMHTILNCLPVELANDEFLNQLVPPSLTQICMVAMLLTKHG